MKTLVIGGGMSGLTYGIMSVKNGIETVICERNPRVGKKLAQTGNGKCNIGNANIVPDCFNQSGIVNAVLNSVPVEVFSRFLRSCGIYTTADNAGRMYPISENASSVVDCLRFQFTRYGGKIQPDCPVTRIERRGEKYIAQIGGAAVVFDKVVLACGSASGAAETCAKSLVGEDYFTETCPSLVPVKIIGMDKLLNGLRVKADVTLLSGGKVAQESGEVLFKDYGLSGICIYNLSAAIARDVVRGVKRAYEFSLDLLPRFSQTELQNLLQARADNGWQSQHLFLGLLHNKLAEALVKRVGNNPCALAQEAKNMKFKVDKLLDYSKSQVTAGGIDEQFVDLQTLATPNGIVALGEVLNVDGLCGGNNLYFAAASALYLFDEKQREIAFNKQ